MDILIEQHLFGFQKLGSKIIDYDGFKQKKSAENGYSINTTDGYFSSLFLCFTEGYHSYKAFKGKVKFKAEEFTFNERTTVEEIELLFGVSVTGFKDDVEISRTFVTCDLQIECSWYHDSDGISFTYMSVEKDDGFYQTSGT